MAFHLVQVSMAAAERYGIQLPRARWRKPQEPNDLAREAVSCNAGLDGSADIGPEVRISFSVLLMRHDRFARTARPSGCG